VWVAELACPEGARPEKCMLQECRWAGLPKLHDKHKLTRQTTGGRTQVRCNYESHEKETGTGGEWYGKHMTHIKNMKEFVPKHTLKHKGKLKTTAYRSPNLSKRATDEMRARRQR
jgi:hypothetical protein